MIIKNAKFVPQKLIFKEALSSIKTTLSFIESRPEVITDTSQAVTHFENISDSQKESKYPPYYFG